MLTYLSPEEIIQFYELKRLVAYQPAPIPARVATILPQTFTGSTVEANLVWSLNAHSHVQAKNLHFAWNKYLGICLILIGLGGALAFVAPYINIEANYQMDSFKQALNKKITNFKQSVTSLFQVPKLTFGTVTPTPTPSPSPELNPLVAPDGTKITPINNDFSLVIPKIGVNAPIIAGVSPTQTTGYNAALKQGVAHSVTSFYPNEDGTVYLFSHSTNYEWFVKDLNAVFYLVKNLEPGDYVVVMYLGDRYTYKIREKKVVSAKEVAYLAPHAGSRNLILQTCWPPGSTWQRLLIFADQIEAKHYQKFEEIK